MPQLNSTHILLVYVWTWLTMCMMAQKTKIILMVKMPTLPTKPQHKKIKKLTTPMPWT
uniref:ATP synthase F0 subunit 8 n=1 Tax=Aipysurus eydouxii TaxID=274825 RepID=UPI001FF4367F|nr:ATP synthase F0 subunit 8 [Aipysurus eydouxii]UOI66212.1 ATP synthase F0 subunit 8 [Aipysurus eydouxii]